MLCSKKKKKKGEGVRGEGRENKDSVSFFHFTLIMNVLALKVSQ